MPDNHLLLANNPEVDCVLKRIKKHVSPTPSKVVLAVIQNPAIYYACLDVKRHESMNNIQKKEMASNAFRNYVVAAFKGSYAQQSARRRSSSFAGLAKGGARADDNADVRTALSIVTNGFLAVWTSFTFTVEHASHLAVARSLWAGVAYLLFSVLVGAAAYAMAHQLGRRWRVSWIAVEWAKRGPLRLVSGMESGAVLAAVGAVAWSSWMAGRHPEKLFWGIGMAVAGGIIAKWFSGLNQGTGLRINWGGWRCNALAFAGLVSAGRYAAGLEPDERQAVLESAFFPALVAQGIGTISGFSDLSENVGDLALEGDYRGAAANVFLNVATAGVAFLARVKFEKILFEASRGD